MTPTVLERLRAVPSRPAVVHKPGHRRTRAQELATKTDRTAAVEKRNREVTDRRVAEIRAFIADGREYTIGQIAGAIGVGIAPTGQLVRHLVSVRELVCQMRDGNKNWYRLAKSDDVFTAPTARSIAVPTFDDQAFDQKLESILASGASYDVRELVRNLRLKWPQVDDARVEAGLADLELAGKVERVPLGSTLRYRRSVPTPAEVA